MKSTNGRFYGGIDNAITGLKLAIVLLLIGFFPQLSQAQDTEPEISVGVADGFQVDLPSQGSGFGVNVRIQQQVEAFLPADNLEQTQLSTFMRRNRLLFSGYTMDGDLNFLLMPALDFGRADLEIARVRWQLKPTWQLTMGQFKLPMTREFLILSKHLPQVDRSFIDARFRQAYDLGIQLEKVIPLNRAELSLKGMVSGGEGPNAPMQDGGYNYTFRAEYFATGKFKAYLPSDISRSDELRMAFAAGINYNDDIHKTGGVTGNALTYTQGEAKIDLMHLFADFIVKKSGYSVMGSVLNRQFFYPANFNKTLFEGSGYMVQAGYMANEKTELTIQHGRYWPRERVDDRFGQEQRVVAGLARFFEGHDLKMQGDIGIITHPDRSNMGEQIIARMLFQIDF